MSLRNKHHFKILISIIILAFVICGVIIYHKFPIAYSNINYINSSIYTEGKDIEINKIKTPPSPIIEKEISPVINVSHIATPKEVKAVYISSWVAGSPKFRDSIIKMIDETELNAIVIDVKDSTGKISFDISNPDISVYGASEKRISNVLALTSMLHEKNIYIIARIAVFQDPHLANLKPKWAITRKSDGGVWQDRKGLSFLDPANMNVRKYTLDIALDAYTKGFDEINFDYIRYPSDGNMKDINYKLEPGKTPSDNIEDFFKYISSEIKKENNIPISADLFGLTTEVVDDMGIGQIWEKTLPYFDFVCPMVYPSHYPSGYSGYKNPSMYPYEVINRALASAVNKTKLMNQDIKKIRPWLQDFDLGATYTKEMVRAQIKATYDNGLSSWMLWDPSNKYTPSALNPEKSE